VQVCNNITSANACVLSSALTLGRPGFVLTSVLDVTSQNISVRVLCTHTTSVRGMFCVLSPGSLGEALLYTCVDYKWRVTTILSFGSGFCEGNARRQFIEYGWLFFLSSVHRLLDTWAFTRTRGIQEQQKLCEKAKRNARTKVHRISLQLCTLSQSGKCEV